METSRLTGTTIEASRDVPTPFVSRLWQMLTLDDRLGRRTAVVAWLAAAIGLGLYTGWGWIVAAGLSSLVLAVLPCAAMCALGLCGGFSGRKCSDTTAASAPRDRNP